MAPHDMSGTGAEGAEMLRGRRDDRVSERAAWSDVAEFGFEKKGSEC